MHTKQEIKLFLCLWILTMTTARSLNESHNLDFDVAKILVPATTENEISNDAVFNQKNLAKMSQKYIIPPVIPEEDMSASSDIVFDHVDFESEDADAETFNKKVIAEMKQQQIYDVFNTSAKYNATANTKFENQKNDQNLYNFDITVKEATEQTINNYVLEVTETTVPTFVTENDISTNIPLKQLLEIEYLEPRTAASNIEALDDENSTSGFNRDFKLLGEITGTNFDTSNSVTQRTSFNEDNETFRETNLLPKTSDQIVESNYEETTTTTAYSTVEINNETKNFETTTTVENLGTSIETILETISIRKSHAAENSLISEKHNLEDTTPNLIYNKKINKEIDDKKINAKRTAPTNGSIFSTTLLTSIPTIAESKIPDTTLPTAITSHNSTTPANVAVEEGFIGYILTTLTRLMGLNDIDSHNKFEQKTKDKSIPKATTVDNKNHTQSTEQHLLPLQNFNFTQPALYLKPFNLSRVNQSKNVVGYGVLVIPKNFTHLLKPWNFTKNVLTKETAGATTQKSYAKYGKSGLQSKAADKPSPKHLYFGNFNGTVLLNNTFWKPWKNHTKFSFYNTTKNGLRPFSLFLPLKKQYFLQLQQQQQQQQRSGDDPFLKQWVKSDQNEDVIVSTVAPLQVRETQEKISDSYLQQEKKKALQFEFEIPKPLIQLYRSIFGA